MATQRDMLPSDVPRTFGGDIFLKKWANPDLFSVYFGFSTRHNLNFKLIRALTVCLGFEPGVAGWKEQTNPLSYGGIECDIWFL